MFSSSVAVIPRHLLRWRRLKVSLRWERTVGDAGPYKSYFGIETDAQWAPLRNWCVTLASVASLRDPSLTLEDDARGHGGGFFAPIRGSVGEAVVRIKRRSPHPPCKARSPFSAGEGFFAPLQGWWKSDCADFGVYFYHTSDKKSPTFKKVGQVYFKCLLFPLRWELWALAPLRSFCF